MKMIVTRGLPGSGKTTWAKQYQKDHPGIVRVNRDSLRDMIHDSVYTKENEEFITMCEESIAEFALMEDHDVIIDDTNLNPKTFYRWQEIAENQKNILCACTKTHDCEFVVQDFDTPLEQCIENDKKRTGKWQVGEAVIRRFYDKYMSEEKHANTT